MIRDRIWPLPDEVVARQTYPNSRPRDAATLILTDSSTGRTRVLLGRRHSGHVFMANALVFPGGGVEPADHRVPFAGALPRPTEEKLLIASRRTSPGRARALAIAAIRELAEETGLCIGRPADAKSLKRLESASPAWAPFVAAGLIPDLSALAYICRAVTPPRMIRRFDTRFFAADLGAVRHRQAGAHGPDSELTELIWAELDGLDQLDLHAVTRQALADFSAFRACPNDPAAPVPFYRARGRQTIRDLT